MPIHPTLIKRIKCFLIKPLKILFNKSIQLGIVPHDWKIANVTPTYKNNRKPFNVESYRPICQTSPICKIFERIIRSKITLYLDEHGVITPEQHGFTKGRSTTTNLLSTLNDWTKAIDEKFNVDALYIDLAKAFDSVVHSKLLYKLSLLGLGGNLLKWFEMYLTGRSQQVKVNKAVTMPSEVISGIPQGTILGPFLFNIYINDLPSKTNSCKVTLYADDAKMYKTISNEDDFQAFSQDIVNVEDFFNDWQLNVNQNKCELLHLGHDNPKNNYEINGSSIPDKPIIRDLGVLLDEKLLCRNHISAIVRTAYFRLKQFNNTFECREMEFLVFMFTTYIRPILESNTQVWSPYQIGDIDTIERVQRRFTKSVLGLHNKEYVERLQILGLSSLECRRIYFDLILLYKMCNNLIDIDFESLFQFNRSTTRGHKYKIMVKHARLNTRKFFFCNRVVPIWNNLPDNIVEAQSLALFKSKLGNFNLDVYCKGRT